MNTLYFFVYFFVLSRRWHMVYSGIEGIPIGQSSRDAVKTKKGIGVQIDKRAQYCLSGSSVAAFLPPRFVLGIQ